MRPKIPNSNESQDVAVKFLMNQKSSEMNVLNREEEKQFHFQQTLFFYANYFMRTRGSFFTKFKRKLRTIPVPA